MSVELQEIDTVVAIGVATGAATGAAESHLKEPYPTGGEVSAMTLITDVRAIRQRLDGVEVALRGLGVRMEELTPGPAASADGAGSRAASAPPGSLEELRKALTGDLQADLHKNAKQSTLFTGVMLLVMLSGLGGLGWMVHQLSQLVKQLE